MVPVNYLAVVASMIVMMVLGFLWYGPLFGKKWSRLMGWSDDTTREMQKGGNMFKSYAIMALGALAMSFVLSHMIVFASTFLSEFGIAAGLQTGFWVWLGFVAPLTVGPVLWENKPWTLWFINAGYYLVGLLLIGSLLALWV